MAASELDPRKLISIDGSAVVLAPNEDVDDLQRRIQGAVKRPRSVQINAANGTDLRFLISAESRVTIAVVPPWAISEQPPRVDIETLEIFDL